MFSSNLGTEVVPADLSNAGPRVFASATRDKKMRKLFVKVVNATSTPQTIAIDLEGAGKIEKMAVLTTMDGKTPNATNTIDAPNVVVPHKQTVSVAGSKFPQRFAPYSVNVLELSY
jgi:alpha-N-arabinofuranosidase